MKASRHLKIGSAALGVLLAFGSVSAQAALTNVGFGDHISAGDGFAIFNSGVMTQGFSPEFLGLLDTGRMQVTNPNPIILPAVIRDTDGFYSKVEVSAPVSTLTVDQATSQIYRINSTQRLAGISTQPLASVTKGGAVTFSNLSIDLGTRIVSGSIEGGNGVGTLDNVALWQADTLTTTWSLCASCTVSSFYGQYELKADLSGLHLTDNGKALVAQSLGLLSLGKSAFNSIGEFGTLSATVGITTYIGAVGGVNITAVPEPGTYALMGLGLVGLALTKRRAAASVAP